MSAAAASSPTGTLVAWGGGDDNRLLDWLTQHCEAQPEGARRAEIVVAATPVRPLITGRNYANAFRRRGFSQVNILAFNQRSPPDSRTHLRRLAAANLVFCTGGDQECLTDALRGTQFLDLLRDRYRHDGLTVAGTSAGAAALAERMIVSGHGWRSLLSGRVRLAEGLGLAPGVFFDTHFAERGRFGRLVHAVLREPNTLGLGIAEETGVIWQPSADGTRSFSVVGDEMVTLLDGRQSTAPGLEIIPYNDPISGQNVRLHLLTAGQGWQE